VTQEQESVKQAKPAIYRKNTPQVLNDRTAIAKSVNEALISKADESCCGKKLTGRH